jgi:MOSC domain-containing protein YiiM
MKRILKIAINKTKIKDELQIPKMGFYYDPVANWIKEKGNGKLTN